MPNNFKNINLNLFLFLILAIISALSLMAGKVFVPLNEWMSGDLKSLIIMELRLPRAIIGILIGAGLGMSGAVMQGYLRLSLIHI